MAWDLGNQILEHFRSSGIHKFHCKFNSCHRGQSDVFKADKTEIRVTFYEAWLRFSQRRRRQSARVLRKLDK